MRDRVQVERPGHVYRLTLASLLFFTTIAGDFWRNLLSWYGWGAICVVLAVLAAIELVRSRPRWRALPYALYGFLLLAAASVAWSQYPRETALGLLGTLVTTVAAAFIAMSLAPDEIVRALAIALRWVLGLSLAFEAVVAAVLRQPILPFFTDYDGPVPQAFYWSRGLLFEGGRIQGIAGNANLLAFAALLALIVFGVQTFSGNAPRALSIGGAIVAVACLALTRSSTVLVAAAGVAVTSVLVLSARALGRRGRVALAGTVIGVVAIALGVILSAPGLLARLLGRSEDLTGRLDIWASVTELAAQRPILGWGWVSYWAPWVEPFDDLAVRKGVTYLQAHNAWLDVWLQLGVLGVAVLAVLVVGAAMRSWRLATNPSTHAYRVLPLLVLAMLFVHSLAESRLLIESGWMLLVVIAIVAKQASRRLPPRTSSEPRSNVVSS